MRSLGQAVKALVAERRSRPYSRDPIVVKCGVQETRRRNAPGFGLVPSFTRVDVVIAFAERMTQHEH
jgi:hypothetical protein